MILGEWGVGDGYRLSLSLFFARCLLVSLFLSVCRRGEGGLGHRIRGSISSQAETGSCHCLDSCHTNTPTTITGALMGLSLTWERGSKVGREASGE